MILRDYLRTVGGSVSAELDQDDGTAFKFVFYYHEDELHTDVYVVALGQEIPVALSEATCIEAFEKLEKQIGDIE